MPALKQYQLFISHSWKYNFQYENLMQLLREAKRFYFLDYSVPKDDPLQVSPYGLYSALENQIKHANVFIIIAGKNIAYSDTIQDELNIAKKYNKPIIAIKPFGNTIIPTLAINYATDIIGWNTLSVVEAIRKYAK